jgi:mono/diheme cytochrome c family protein
MVSPQPVTHQPPLLCRRPHLKAVAHYRLLALTGLLVCVGVGCIAGLGRLEPIPAEALRATPARLARGTYLVEHVTVCLDCHSQRDWDTYSAPIVAGTEGQGGEVFDDRHGVRGVVYGTNITPAGLAEWTDDELLRAITAGVNREGDVLFPVMPYRSYRHLTQSDAAAIISYVRALRPIEHPVPPRQLGFFVEFLIRSFAMDKVRLAPAVSEGADGRAPTQIQYGRYLAQLANCGDCHTPRNLAGEPEPGREMAGGVTFTLPQGTAWSANITPDPDTGIGRWTQAAFVARFKAFSGPRSPARTVDASRRNTPMPWAMYAGMTQTDLEAIYVYLQQLPAVGNRVAVFAPTPERTETAGDTAADPPVAR